MDKLSSALPRPLKPKNRLEWATPGPLEIFLGRCATDSPSTTPTSKTGSPGTPDLRGVLRLRAGERVSRWKS
jgi:hypothetical protein